MCAEEFLTLDASFYLHYSERERKREREKERVAHRMFDFS